MEQNKFKKIYKPASCTIQPWRHLIVGKNKEDILRTIRQETIEAYGYSMDECPKRKVCLSKQCLGRPLPWLSPTAKPYLEQLKATQTIVDNEMYISNCSNCPIYKTCNSPCYQINDYMNRHNEQEPQFVQQETLDNHIIENVIDNSDIALPLTGIIPWEILSNTKQLVIKKYMYEQKDFLAIAKELDLNNQARVKYEFYSALTKLSEYATMRKFIEEKQGSLEPKHLNILNSIYYDNKTIIEVAQQNSVTKQAMAQLISRLIKKYNVRWQIFVRKEGNKLIYNVPTVLK